jgi:hypothetical protein
MVARVVSVHMTSYRAVRGEEAPPVGRPSPRPSPREERGEGEEAAVRGRAWADAAAKAR